MSPVETTGRGMALGLPAAGWKCPACGADQSGPLEAGCGACGAGRPGFRAATPPPPLTERTTTQPPAPPAPPAQGLGVPPSVASPSFRFDLWVKSQGSLPAPTVAWCALAWEAGRAVGYKEGLAQRATVEDVERTAAPVPGPPSPLQYLDMTMVDCLWAWADNLEQLSIDVATWSNGTPVVRVMREIADAIQAVIRDTPPTQPDRRNDDDDA